MTTEESIPVDLTNPGQVFACMGFLEACQELVGNAEGGFSWEHEGKVRFCLRAAGTRNPFEVVLEFLSLAKVQPTCPTSKMDSLTSWSLGKKLPQPRCSGDIYPDSEVNEVTLPLCLHYGEQSFSLYHWVDGSGLQTFKLYAGNRSSLSIAKAMLSGTRKNPTKKFPQGQQKRLGVQQLWETRQDEMLASPLDVLTPMGGCFNFDPRAGWTCMGAGYSPNDHGHLMASSPTVELLAALGLNYARPRKVERRVHQYGVWNGLLSPSLARAALGASPIVPGLRFFQFELVLSGKNKIVTFSKEETK